MWIAGGGGGIVGIAITHALLDERHEVEVIDRDGASGAASVGNAGLIAHIDVLPLASAKAWAQLPRWTLDPLGPLSIAPAYLPRALTLASALCRREPAGTDGSRDAGNSRPQRGIAAGAWERRLAGLGLSTLLRRRGILSVWINRSDFAAASTLHARQSALGIPVERIDNEISWSVEEREILASEPEAAYLLVRLLSSLLKYCIRSAYRMYCLAMPMTVRTDA
jgi:D-amino-acid dehydrogenase